MRGGARAFSGPAPDPDALRRDRDRGEWLTLSAEGRTGTPPTFPLVTPSTRELALWAREWKRPQAVMWEALGLATEVALYVRSLVTAERLDASVPARTLVRQQQEALGLSLPGLNRLRWRIASTQAPATTRPKTRIRSAKARLQLVMPDAG